MNFLSHHFADAVENEPYYNVGLILPDLIGSVQRRWKVPVASQLNDDKIFEAIAEGCSRHLKVDAYFHGSDFFKDYTAFIKQVFEKNGLKIPGVKLFFVAHIFLELMLDRLILINFEKSSQHFYTDLSAVEPSLLTNFLKAANVEDVQAFLNFFDRFQTLRYLNHYIQDEGLHYALNRIMQRAKQPVFEEALTPNLKNATQEVQTHLAPEFFKIFEELKSKY